MIEPVRVIGASPYPVRQPPPPSVPRFGPGAPALPPKRAATVATVRTGLTILAVGYILCTNYVIFTGGNAPLTPWHLSDGSTGAGAFMLFIGDWLVLLLFQLVVIGSLDYLLTGLLQPLDRTRPAAPIQPLPPPPPGWSVPVPTPSTPLSNLLTDPSGQPPVFVPQQPMPRVYQREQH